MGLSINVGMLAELKRNDEEGIEWFRKSLMRMNSILAENQLAEHNEPEILPSFSSWDFSYPDLHHLRRFAAHVANKASFARSFPESDDPNEDPVLHGEFKKMKSHLNLPFR